MASTRSQLPPGGRSPPILPSRSAPRRLPFIETRTRSIVQGRRTAVAASADHIKALVRSYSSRDDETFYAVALQVAANAARRGHHRFAADMKKLVDAARHEQSKSVVTPILQPKGELRDLVVASFPKVSMQELVVDSDLRNGLNEVIGEQRQRHTLMEKGFPPVHRLLLKGPPGTGKTMTAAVLARELDLPLMTIRLDTILCKYLGETASKLRVVFDSASSHRAVYLFDEFDALGGDRGGNDIGEARRILNSFLLFLENSRPKSIVIAATNHPEILDRALFRRFDLVMTYNLPTPEQSIAVLKARLGRLGSHVDWKDLQTVTSGEVSHADLVKAAERAAKRSLLAGNTWIATETLIATLRGLHGTDSA